MTTMQYLTADLPGTGGFYKQQPQDFQVEEIPLYPCSGKGEHLYLWVEKQGITTHDLLRQIAKGLGLKERALGYAGLKDARALTRQQISVPANRADRLDRLHLRQATILSTTRHDNKLRLGHLSGNRFSILLRNTHADGLQRAERILKQLVQHGVPNRFGEQRYGILNNSHRLGRLLLKKESTCFCRELIGDPRQISDPQWQQAAQAFRNGNQAQALELLPGRMQVEKKLIQSLLSGIPPEVAVLSIPHHHLRLFLSAYQSQLFDRLLEQRLPDLDRLEAGDLAVKHANGACFRVTNAALERQRTEQFEISPSAPLFGHKVLLAEGVPGERETDLLRQENLTLKDWKLGGGLTMPGERRPLRVPLDSVQAKAKKNVLQLDFSLPKGSYATSVLYEVIKPSTAPQQN